MTQDLIRSTAALQRRLCDAGVSSAVIGGLAVAVWGEPRLTRDADIKVLLDRSERDRLLSILGNSYQTIGGDAGDLLRRLGLLFVVDETGARLDLMLSDTAFDVCAVRRARVVAIAPEQTLSVCSPEDLIVYKLISTRPRDYEDAVGVILRQGEALDDEYVVGWLEQFERALDESDLVTVYQEARRRSTAIA